MKPSLARLLVHAMPLGAARSTRAWCGSCCQRLASARRMVSVRWAQAILPGPGAQERANQGQQHGCTHVLFGYLVGPRCLAPSLFSWMCVHQPNPLLCMRACAWLHDACRGRWWRSRSCLPTSLPPWMRQTTSWLCWGPGPGAWGHAYRRARASLLIVPSASV